MMLGMRIDLHTHSIVSDGTDTPGALVRAAGEAGLDVVGLTDHDTFDGIAEAETAALAVGVELWAGVEWSTQLDGESVHLLGYGCEASAPALVAELGRVRLGRQGRVPEMCRRLAELGVPVSVAEVRAMAGGAPSVGRPHFADVMVSKGYVADRAEAFSRFLADDGPAFVPRYATPLGLAIDLVHQTGGVAVVAHPWGRGREHVLRAEVLERLAAEHRLDGIEVWHEDHDATARVDLERLALRLGLVPTGSSDYHGTGKKGHPLGVNLTPRESLVELSARIAGR